MVQMRIIILLTLFFAINSVHAGVFKWVDADGQVHFGDDPKGAANTEKLKVPKSPAPDPETLKRLDNQKRYLDARSGERTTQQEEKAKAEKQKAEYKEYCEKTKERLAILERGGRIYSEGTDGERTYLTDEARLVELAKAQADDKKYCE